MNCDTEEIDAVGHAFKEIDANLCTIMDAIDRSPNELCGQMYRSLEILERRMMFLKHVIRTLHPMAA